MRNRILALVFALASVFAVGQTVIPSVVRTVSSLPISCSGGASSKTTDIVVLVSGGVGKFCTCTQTNTWSCGQVTSVGVTTPSGLNVSPSSITTNGTFAIVWSGSPIPHSALPTLLSADIPWASPGTIGSTTPSTGAFTTITFTTKITGPQYCIASSCITAWPSGGGGGFSNPMTTLGDTMPGGAAGAATRVAGNISTVPGVYTQTGTGSASNLPVWVPSMGGGTNPLFVPSGSLSQGMIPVVNNSGIVTFVLAGVGVDTKTTDYAFACPTDRMGLVEFTLTASHTFTLPQAGSTACTQSNMAMVVRNTSTSTADLIVTAVTSTFLPEGTSSFKVRPGSVVYIYSDAGATVGNYHTVYITRGAGGVNVQTAAYLATSLDEGKEIVMNCTATCAVTLPAASPGSLWHTRVLSIGSTLATVSLNSLRYNTGTTPPTLTTGKSIEVFTDSANYFGDMQ